MDIMLSRILELLGRQHGATKALADALNIAGNSVSNWKNGHSKSYRQYAPQIAEYFGVSLDWLCGLTDEKEKKKEPDPKNEGELSAEFDKLFGQLTPEEQKIIRAQIIGILQNRE